MFVNKKGNILFNNETFIAHGCNAKGKMGKGLAQAIRAKYPEAYDVYMQAYAARKLALGAVIYAELPGITIANCITQAGYGNSGVHVDYEAIIECFENISKYMETKNIRRIAIPRIGAGLGGGDWTIISEMIELVFSNQTSIEIVVYQL